MDTGDHNRSRIELHRRNVFFMTGGGGMLPRPLPLGQPSQATLAGTIPNQRRRAGGPRPESHLARQGTGLTPG